MRKLSLVLAFAAMLLSSFGAFATNQDSLILARRLPSGDVEVTCKQLTHDSMWKVTEFNTAFNLSGISDIKPVKYIGNTVHIYKDTMHVMSGNPIYVNNRTFDTTLVWHTNDTDTVYLDPVITATVTATTTGFTHTVTFNTGNIIHGAKLTEKVIWDTTTWGYYYYDSMLSGFTYGGPTSHTSGITSMSYPGHGWVMDILTTKLGSDTSFIYFSVLPPPLPPVAGSVGTPAATSHTLTPHHTFNNYGASGTCMSYRRLTSTGPNIDSLPQSMTPYYGVQDVYPTYSGLPASDTSWFVLKVQTPYGTAFSTPVRGITTAAFTVDMFGSITQIYDSLKANFHWTNVPSGVANVTINFAQGTPSAIIDTRNFPYLTGIGSLPVTFNAPDSGDYFFIATGYDDHGGIVMVSPTVLMHHVNLTRIDDAHASRDTVYVGERDTLYTNVFAAQTVTVSTFTGVSSALDTLVTPTYTIPGVYTYTVTAHGFNIVTDVITVVVIHRPPVIVSITAVPDSIAYGQTTYIKYKMTGVVHGTLTGKGTITADTATYHTTALYFNTWFYINGTGADSSIVMDSVLVKVAGPIVDTTTQVENVKVKNVITVYPTLVTENEVTVDMSMDPVAGTYIEVFDFAGRKLSSSAMTSRTEKINVTNFANGGYTLRIISDDLTETRRITVSH